MAWAMGAELLVCIRIWLLMTSTTSSATWKSAWFFSSTSVILPSLVKTLKNSSSRRQPSWMRPVVGCAGSSSVIGPSAKAKTR